MDKSKNKARSFVTNEPIDLLHQENFNLSFFEEMIKRSVYYQVIFQEVTEWCKKNHSHTSDVLVSTESTLFVT